MSRFYDETSPDERNDWRKHPLTELLFEVIAQWKRNAADAAVGDLNSGRTDSAKRMAAHSEAYSTILEQIAEEEKT